MIRFRWIAGILSLVLCGIGSIRVYEHSFSENAVLYFFDVGQGDAALIKMPFGENYLLDSGGGWNERWIGTELAGELARLGALHIKEMILSHLDSDHAEGALTLLRNLKTERLVFSGYLANYQEKRSWLWSRIRAEAANRKTRLIPIYFPQTVYHGTARIHFYPVHKSKLNSNDGLAIGLEIYGCRFLLMGDLDRNAEKNLPSEFYSPTTVLKVGHHGSRSSSHREWLEQISPRFSVISVGARNRYGHPNETVLKELDRLGSHILRTDLHGYVSFAVSPNGTVTCRSAVNSNCGTYRCR